MITQLPYLCGHNVKYRAGLDKYGVGCYSEYHQVAYGNSPYGLRPERGLAMEAKTIEIILKGDAFEDAAMAIDEGRKVCLEGAEHLLVEQEGGEFKWYYFREYHIMRGREYRLTFGKE